MSDLQFGILMVSIIGMVSTLWDKSKGDRTMKLIWFVLFLVIAMMIIIENQINPV